jgi:hypothetical protein
MRSQLSVHRLVVDAGGGMRVEAVRDLAAPGHTFAKAGAGGGGAEAAIEAQRAGEDASVAGAGKQDGLLQAALKLQHIGGRSVALGKRLG